MYEKNNPFIFMLEGFEKPGFLVRIKTTGIYNSKSQCLRMRITKP